MLFFNIFIVVCILYLIFTVKMTNVSQAKLDEQEEIIRNFLNTSDNENVKKVFEDYVSNVRGYF